jgi:hypothetical protein
MGWRAEGLLGVRGDHLDGLRLDDRDGDGWGLGGDHQAEGDTGLDGPIAASLYGLE